MTADNQVIYYTLTDEAPSLATCSLLPIVRVFTSAVGIDVKISDVSLAPCVPRQRAIRGAPFPSGWKV